MIRTDCNVSRRISWQNAGAKNATASSGYVTLAATILDNSPGWITAARISLTERTLAGDRLRLLDFKVGDEPCVMTTERFVRRQYLMFIAKYAKSSKGKSAESYG